MDNIYIKLLTEFKDIPIGKYRSISPFMIKHFNKPTATNSQEWFYQNKEASDFMDDVIDQGHLVFDEPEIPVGFYPNGSKKWYDEVEYNFRMTISGSDYLSQHKNIKSANIKASIAIIVSVIALVFTGWPILKNSPRDTKQETQQGHGKSKPIVPPPPIKTQQNSTTLTRQNSQFH